MYSVVNAICATYNIDYNYYQYPDVDELVGADDELPDIVVLLELGVDGVVVDEQLSVLRQR